MTHTPGPWNISAGLNTGHFDGTREYKEIAQVLAIHTGSAQAIANARLIAAAPEMYELIHANVRLLERMALTVMIDDALAVMLEANRIILARIEG